MHKDHDYLGADGDRTTALKGQVLILQLKGAAYAAIFCLAVVLTILAIAWVGKMLPDEAREADDPSPWSYNLTVDLSEHV